MQREHFFNKWIINPVVGDSKRNRERPDMDNIFYQTNRYDYYQILSTTYIAFMSLFIVRSSVYFSCSLLLSKSPSNPERIFKNTLIGYQIIAFILSFFRNVVRESNQIDSLKNAQDDPKVHKTSFYIF